MDRRAYLTRIGAVSVGAGVAGCMGGNEQPDESPFVPAEPNYQGWFAGNGKYQGTRDRRGQSAVTIRVGVTGPNGFYYFEPIAVAVSPGTAVTWRWTGKGGTHNVRSTNGTFDSGALVKTTGHTFEHTLASPGIYRYVCDPHQALGMKGAVFAALDDSGA